jgi:hypothetical protein
MGRSLTGSGSFEFLGMQSGQASLDHGKGHGSAVAFGIA